MKSDRLLSILLLLQTRGRVRADELARRLEVSTRTIYRDVESLSTAGVPVYAERGRHGGISLLDGFRTDVTGLTSDEARALFVLAAQGTHSALGLDGAIGSALRKVMAALPAPHRPAAELTSRRILVDPGRWLAGPQPSVDLDVLNTAVFTDRRLRIRYRHGGETTTHRYTVDPYGLVAKAGTWYLVADRRARAQLFRADRILDATVTEAPVRRRDGVELADAWEALRRQVEERPANVRLSVRVRRGRLEMFRRIVGPFVVHVEDEELAGTELGDTDAEDPGAEDPDADDSGVENTDAENADVEGRGEGADSGSERGERDERDERGDGNGAEAAVPAQSPGADDWVAVSLAYPVLRAARQLLQFGADVEVLEPAAARAELMSAATSVTALYGEGEDADADGSGDRSVE
ncbi:helix-turn-helix transcriptional regulator [Streptomyces marispadix]|uniref:WYL domain-containing protein n=1 Tax=Streptomyces marispadix TaxID=2922868 RepID=A0ABS9SZ37_9ACTN|nr:WYL domain-containing protein [Streptomyces marispadix]MCH6161536.1 WYL domain-containing protein [Streptomyces marispadix]